MPHPTLTPGKKARGGRSMQLSVYLMPEHESMYKRFRAEITGPALSQLLGAALLDIMHDEGYYYVACPHCGAVHLERDVIDGLNDEWMCPTCRHLTEFGAWKEVPAPTGDQP